MVPILLGRVGEETFGVIGEVGDDETPDEDEGAVGHVHAPDEDEAKHDDEAHEQREIGAEIVGVQIKFETAGAEFLEVLLPPSDFAGQLWRPGRVSS